jgi:universal stress protein E
MTTFNKEGMHVLVVLAHEEDKAIPLASAARLCAAMSATMTVFVSVHHIFSHREYEGIEDDLAKMVKRDEDEIKTLLEEYAGTDYLNSIVISWQQKLVNAISTLVDKNSYDLILKAPHQQSEFEQFFVDGLDRYFIRDCPLPVWLVKSRQWDDSYEVMACVDMSDNEFDNHLMNRKILAESDSVAKVLRAEMHVVDCYYGEIGTMSIDYNTRRGFKREASVKKQHVEKLKLYINEYALSEDVLHFVEGIPDDSIPEKAAAINAEVAVIGNNEDNNVITRIFGDTAAFLAKAMPCDLLVVKPDAIEGEE